MRLLLDTNILLWAGAGIAPPARMAAGIDLIIRDATNELFFSVVGIWEIVIKAGRGRQDFTVFPPAFRRNLLDNGFGELSITSEHVLAVGALPAIHGDPFDRILIAQATVEGMTLLTSDKIVAQYPGPIRLV